MPDSPDSRLSIRFQRESRATPDNSTASVPSISNPYQSIPASTLGYVLAGVSELMRSTWDYAITNINDERFDYVRKLEAQEVIQRREIELVVVDTRTGSLEVILDWLVPIVATGIFPGAIQGMIPNALWDLTKYSFWSIHELIVRRGHNSKSIYEDNDIDPITNKILPDILEIARNGYRESDNGIIKTHFHYHGSDGKEIEFTIDKYSQGVLLETNLVDTKIVTRLAGTIEGINWRKRSIAVRWDLFPEEEMICDIDGMDFDELDHLVPSSFKQPPRRLGFDVELAWRRGVANVFPPDAIRVIGIFPEDQLLRPTDYRIVGGLSRPSITEFNEPLSDDELKFLQWFSWADTNWDNPNIHGVVGYLTRNHAILGHSCSRRELLEIIQSLVRHGIILKARGSTKRGFDSQVLRLNRNHPVVLYHDSRQSP